MSENQNEVTLPPAAPVVKRKGGKGQTGQGEAVAAPAAPDANVLLAELARMQRERDEAIASMAKMAQRGQGIKVSEKGACSVYGLGKWPVTLYPSQWEKLFEREAEIKAFIAANLSRFAVKESK